MKSKKLLIFFAVLFTSSVACGQFSIGLESQSEADNAIGSDTQTIEKPDSDLLDLSDSGTGSVSEGASLYWSEAEDHRFGIRFAVPCFWQVLIPTPEQDPLGYGGFPVANFTQEYLASLGPKSTEVLWTNGGMKVDFGYIRADQYGLSDTDSMEALIAAMYPEEKPEYSPADLISADLKTINGQSAYEITESSIEFETIGTYYLFQVSPGLFFTFRPYPHDAVNHPDVQAILHSIAIFPDISVNIPDVFPANPPEGMQAPCMKAVTDSITIDEGRYVEGYNCVDPSPESLDWLVCNLQDAIRSKNLSAIINRMANPFAIGYWLSEWTSNTPEYSIDMIQRNFLPEDTSGIVFTNDRTQFPDLVKYTPRTPEEMMGPDTNVVEVIFTGGWGEDGKTGAFLFLAQDESGIYYWAGLLIGFEYIP